MCAGSQWKEAKAGLMEQCLQWAENSDEFYIRPLLRGKTGDKAFRKPDEQQGNLIIDFQPNDNVMIWSHLISLPVLCCLN